jgi:type II secretory pathway predicted ATPase ExeA
MTIQRLQSHWGFTTMPFGRGLAPSMLHRHGGHAEAVARIAWCIDHIGNHRNQNVPNGHLRETCAA